jgi:hypothetical protein
VLLCASRRFPSCEVGSRRGTAGPFPAPPSQTGHEVLPHPAFPRAVDRLHSPVPPGLATGPSNQRGSSTLVVLAVAVAHPARGPWLRRVMLSTPIIATIASSDFRSALRHFTFDAYRLRLYRQPQGRHSLTVIPGAETDLSCSIRDCVTVPLPIRRRVHRCRNSRLFAPSVAFAQLHEARLPHESRSPGDRSRRGYRIPLVRTGHLLPA